MKQEDKVLMHLKLDGRVTPYEAFENLHITRLAAVIHRLRSKGHEIVTITHTKKEDGVRWAEYRLK